MKKEGREVKGIGEVTRKGAIEEEQEKRVRGEGREGGREKEKQGCDAK